jgi:hypothetical protein
VIERIFGVVKRKFKILGTVAEYSFDTQVDLVLALAGLFNFIQAHEDISDDLRAVDIDLAREELEDEINLAPDYTQGSGDAEMKRKRDKIAKDMWENYQRYLRQEIELE